VIFAPVVLLGVWLCWNAASGRVNVEQNAAELSSGAYHFELFLNSATFSWQNWVLPVLHVKYFLYAVIQKLLDGM